jgi:hypothetical protein
MLLVCGACATRESATDTVGLRTEVREGFLPKGLSVHARLLRDLCDHEMRVGDTVSVVLEQGFPRFVTGDSDTTPVWPWPTGFQVVLRSVHQDRAFSAPFEAISGEANGAPLTLPIAVGFYPDAEAVEVGACYPTGSIIEGGRLTRDIDWR